MSKRCCAFTHCTNNATKITKWKENFCDIHKCNYGIGRCVCEPPFYLYPFPSIKKDNHARLKWTAIVNRKNGTENWTPTNDSRVCSTHFIDEHPSINNPYPTLNLGYTPVRPIVSRNPPTERTFTETPSKKRRANPLDSNCTETVQGSNNDHAYCTNNANCNFCEQNKIKITELQGKIEKLELELSASKNEKLKKSFKIQTVLKSDKKVKYYTGIPSIEAFNEIFEHVEPHLSTVRYWKGPKRLCNPLKQKQRYCSAKRQLSAKEELILCLMKLRLGMLNEDLADRFGVSWTHVSNVFVTWLKILSELLGELVFNPPAEIVRGNLPPSFLNYKYQNVRHIIDCSEVFIEKPNNLEAAALTWSDYKRHNTAKFLVSITPAGLINYVSKCYGGRTSDKYITLHSGFLNLVEPYDKVLADRGFQMREDFALSNAELIIPPGRRGVSQMSKLDVQHTKEIANRRIYIEQAIRRMKCFRILKYELPLTMLSHLDDMIVVIDCICNLSPPLPNYNKS